MVSFKQFLSESSEIKIITKTPKLWSLVSTYPEIKIKEALVNRWKKEIGLEIFEFKTWKEIWGLIKNSGFKYRVPIPDMGFRKLSSARSKVVYQNYKLAQVGT